MANFDSPRVTQLLVECGGGNQSALEESIQLVCDELHRIAKRYLQRESAGQAMQTTEKSTRRI